MENQPFVDRLSNQADMILRFLDFRVQRIHGGLLQRFGIDHHNIDALLWPGLVAAALWTGMPTFGSHILISLLVLVAFMLVCGVFLRNSNSPRRDLVIQCSLILALAGFVWAIGPDQYAEQRPYRHVLVPFAAITALGLLVAALAVTPFFALLLNSSNYGAALVKTELFQSRGERAPTGWPAVARALLSVVGRPLGWLLPTAIVVIVTDHDRLFYDTLEAAFFWIAFMMLLGLNDRLDAIWSVLSARFFRNAALLVSLVIITLAVARILDVTYVTTVLDTAQSVQILLFLFFAYAITWWYDYWIERLMAQELLKVACSNEASSGSVPYQYEVQEPCTSVPNDRRVIQVHGIGRFLVAREVDGEPRFHTWKFRDFFHHVAASGAPGGKATPQPAQVVQRIDQFSMLSGSVVTALLITFMYWLHLGAQHPQVIARADRSAGVSLGELLDRRRNAGRPAILVAASGGGTRAALFTAAILEGLRTEGYAADIVLGSGVSGGAASLAYFASKRGQLVAENADAAWSEYFSAMRQPFIRDVLERGSEWRIASGGRLGVLLAESFQRRWQLGGDRDQLGDIGDFGIILNTALAAHLDRAETPNGGGKVDLMEVARKDTGYTRPDVAGGRLILTNLALNGAFSEPRMLFNPRPETPVVVDDNQVRLESAAALSANFPPVFPNAAVDIDDRVRYWVTDGGAADNRGLETLLYALRHALRSRETNALPSVHVVVVEASGIDETFRQDRGITTVQGAGAQFAARLSTELVHSIAALYPPDQRNTRFQVHLVAMPRFMRAVGTFGTHWMLQDHISLRRDGKAMQTSGEAVVDVLRALYAKRQIAEDGGRKEALDWGRACDEYTKEWGGFIASLKAPRVTSTRAGSTSGPRAAAR